ncbi:hypothetical protein [Bacillus sp. Marseille-Q3570]|nr:hypothetical protein [Bacillus sp. Marseille-Q3570]
MLSGLIIVIVLCFVELAGAHFVLCSMEDEPGKLYERYEDFFYEE